MQVLNGNESEIIGALKRFGLCQYEARMYFTLLTIGEAKVMRITRKASVPQSKAYDVLESLMAKGFVEQTQAERPKQYRAKVLEEVMDKVITDKQRQIDEIRVKKTKLQRILQEVVPLHQAYKGWRLFSPSYRRGD